MCVVHIDDTPEVQEMKSRLFVAIMERAMAHYKLCKGGLSMCDCDCMVTTISDLDNEILDLETRLEAFDENK
jgi:hypothetical protein